MCKQKKKRNMYLIFASKNPIVIYAYHLFFGRSGRFGDTRSHGGTRVSIPHRAWHIFLVCTIDWRRSLCLVSNSLGRRGEVRSRWANIKDLPQATPPPRFSTPRWAVQRKQYSSLRRQCTGCAPPVEIQSDSSSTKLGWDTVSLISSCF